MRFKLINLGRSSLAVHFKHARRSHHIWTVLGRGYFSVLICQRQSFARSNLTPQESQESGPCPKWIYYVKIYLMRVLAITSAWTTDSSTRYLQLFLLVVRLVRQQHPNFAPTIEEQRYRARPHHQHNHDDSHLHATDLSMREREQRDAIVNVQSTDIALA